MLDPAHPQRTIHTNDGPCWLRIGAPARLTLDAAPNHAPAGTALDRYRGL
jgi:hypothetical protein